MERTPDGADGNNRSGEPEGAAAQRNSVRPPPSRSGGEKSVGNSDGKGPTAGEKSDGARAGEGPRGAKSKSSAPLSSGAQARHDALVAAKALMLFPPSTGDTKVYQEWRARVGGLLDFADGGPGCEPTRAPTVNGPGAGGDKTREPRGQPHGERQDETVPRCTGPPVADRLHRDRGKTISVGSSTTRNRDLRDDLNNRQYEDMCTRIKRRRERHRREDRDDDIA